MTKVPSEWFNFFHFLPYFFRHDMLFVFAVLLLVSLFRAETMLRVFHISLRGQTRGQACNVFINIVAFLTYTCWNTLAYERPSERHY